MLLTESIKHVQRLAEAAADETDRQALAAVLEAAQPLAAGDPPTPLGGVWRGAAALAEQAHKTGQGNGWQAQLGTEGLERLTLRLEQLLDQFAQLLAAQRSATAPEPMPTATAAKNWAGNMLAEQLGQDAASQLLRALGHNAAYVLACLIVRPHAAELQRIVWATKLRQRLLQLEESGQAWPALLQLTWQHKGTLCAKPLPAEYAAAARRDLENQRSATAAEPVPSAPPQPGQPGATGPCGCGRQLVPIINLCPVCQRTELEAELAEGLEQGDQWGHERAQRLASQGRCVDCGQPLRPDGLCPQCDGGPVLADLEAWPNVTELAEEMQEGAAISAETWAAATAADLKVQSMAQQLLAAEETAPEGMALLQPMQENQRQLERALGKRAAALLLELLRPLATELQRKRAAALLRSRLLQRPGPWPATIWLAQRQAAGRVDAGPAQWRAAAALDLQAWLEGQAESDQILAAAGAVPLRPDQDPSYYQPAAEAQPLGYCDDCGHELLPPAGTCPQCDTEPTEENQ